VTTLNLAACFVASALGRNMFPIETAAGLVCSSIVLALTSSNLGGDGAKVCRRIPEAKDAVVVAAAGCLPSEVEIVSFLASPRDVKTTRLVCLIFGGANGCFTAGREPHFVQKL